MKIKISGMSLLEVMLVLAIGAAIVVMGINEYRQYKMQVYFGDIKKNVDVLFQALGQYYQANCRSLTDEGSLLSGTAHVSQGALAEGGTIGNQTVQYSWGDEGNNRYTLYSIPSIQETLIDTHYLASNWLTNVPFIDADNYFVGYILEIDTKQAYACWNINGVTCTDKQDIQQDNVAFWMSYVSIKVNDDPDGSKTLALVGPTGASCASSFEGGCSDDTSEPQFLVWRRLPTKFVTNMTSNLWPSQMQEALFNQQYSHDVMYEMTPGVPINYFTCGN